MSQMRAVQYDAYGPPEVLQVRMVPVPRIRPGHVLVRVAATSVNAADTVVRAGKLKLVSGRSFPRGAGFDFAGTVTEAASDVTGLAAGDEVWGFVNAVRNPGPSVGAAEYVLAPPAARPCAPARPARWRPPPCPPWAPPRSASCAMSSACSPVSAS